MTPQQMWFKTILKIIITLGTISVIVLMFIWAAHLSEKEEAKKAYRAYNGDICNSSRGSNDAVVLFNCNSGRRYLNAVNYEIIPRNST